MRERIDLPVAAVRVPSKRLRTLDPARVEEIAEDMLENGQTTPIQVRTDKAGYVLIEGLHRLEALKALGEETIAGYLVQARPR
ncbi:ParB N-terminal domain-containing protein [Rhodobacteraceae bacterium NNCM2]|nr:ParB N-terminal domain-containing protein [Coraliihabitans acroporae]